MMTIVWKPILPLRFKTDEHGRKILQQCWAKFVMHSDGWNQTNEHEWRDVPLDPTDNFFTQIVEIKEVEHE